MKLLLLFSLLLTVSCSREADVASYNLSREADSFKINRRIVFYNGITGDYILVIEGLCSIGNADGPREVTVTCKTSHDSYKKHFLGISDNVTFFSEQVENSKVSEHFYKVVFKPSSVIPDMEIR